MLSLQFGELPTFRGVIGKLIVGEDCPGNNVRSHIYLSAAHPLFWAHEFKCGSVVRESAFTVLAIFNSPDGRLGKTSAS